MAFSFVTLFAIVISTAHTNHAPHPTSVKINTGKELGSTLLVKDIILNVSINNTNNNLHHNITYGDVQDLIDRSGDEYLEEILINRDIGHKLDFDIIKDGSEDDRLSVDVHIVLYKDTINADQYEANVDEKDINADDMRGKIQYDSDLKYGKHTINIKVNHHNKTTTIDPIPSNTNNIHTNTPYVLYVLLILIGMVFFVICGIFGCWEDVCKDNKVQREQITSNPSIAVHIQHQLSNDDMKCITECGERYLSVNNVETMHDQGLDEMSDSEKLYEIYDETVLELTLPHLPDSDSDIYEPCNNMEIHTTPYETVRE